MKPADKVTTVKELETALSFFPPETKVESIWEGRRNIVKVFQAADGVVLLGCENGADDQVIEQELPCAICGNEANGLSCESPRCYSCWSIPMTHRLF